MNAPAIEKRNYWAYVNVMCGSQLSDKVVYAKTYFEIANKNSCVFSLDSSRK